MRAKTAKKLNEARNLIANGMTVRDACAKADLPMPTYQKNKAYQPKSEYKTKLMVPIPPSNDSYLVDKLKSENAALRKMLKELL